MEHLTPWEICVIVVGAILALATAVNTLGSAFEKISKARQAAQAPNKAQDGRLADLERRMGDVERMLGNDKHSLDKINAGLEASFQVQLALLDHALNGNNVTQMQTARDGLYDYLTHPDKRKE